MRIIFDIHEAPDAYLSASGNFLTELMIEMAGRYSHHSFIYLIHERLQKTDNLPDNVSIHYPNKILLKWLGKRFWYKYFLIKELTILKADLYVTADNLFLNKTGIRVLLFLIHGTEILQDKALSKKNMSGTKMLVNAIRKADTIITFSVKDRQVVQMQSPKRAAKVKLFLPLPVEIPELKWTEKEMVKIDFAGGVEYFLFAGDLHKRFDLIVLLKAFTLFKKWQQSNMQLVIAGNKTTWTEEFTKQLASFKYRNEVNVMFNPSKETLQKIIAGAYAFVYPAAYDNFPVNILQAMQAGVPVISSPIQVCKEWCANSVMYPETNDASGFANSMQLIYKDERLRSDFIDAAKKHLATCEQNDLAETCMNFFEETIAK